MAVLYGGDAAEFELLQVALAGAGVGVWEYDAGTEIGRTDERTAVMFGLSEVERHAAPLERFLDAIHPDDVLIVKDGISPPEPFDLSYRIIVGGSEMWVRSVGRWGIRDGAMLLLGITIDITAERHRQQRLEVLAHEMRHRVGNTFAILGGLVSFEAEAADSAADLADRLRDRLVSLSQAQSFSFQGNHIGPETSLSGLIRTVAKPFLTQAHGGFDLEGPDLTLDNDATSLFSLIIYEWLTNALKYGALSSATGEISVSWTTDQDMLHLSWQERMSDGCASPSESGFGDRMQDDALAQRGGKVERTWSGDGVLIEMQMPLTAATGR